VRTRVLYWFRTPPGVRVGRAPIDEDAIRLIEEHHPDIQFDWPQILKGDEEAVPPSRPPRESPREAPRQPAADEHPRVPPRPPAPARPIEHIPVEPIEPVSAAHARLGSEGLLRLRGRYADVLANLTRRVPDEQRREQLREQAERLNPDNWVTDEEVTAALEAYESVLASLREVAGRRRRRRRGRGAPAGADAASPGTAQGGTGEADGGDGSDDGPDDDRAAAEDPLAND
jgi:hypothetical protein